MDMQDKEFDDVFRNKLDGFEMEPSAKVWMGIDETLDKKNRRKAILPWLRIAAGIIMLVSAGILFIPKKTATQHNNRIVKTTVLKITKPKQETLINTPAPQTELATVQTPVKPTLHRAKKAERMVAPVEKHTEVIAKTGPAKTNEQPLLADVPQKQELSNKGVVPGPETALTIKQPDINNTPDQQTRPAMVAQQPTPFNKPAAAAPPKRHGIHSFGDIVNLVANKVEKHRTAQLNDDDDDDESVISEVNKGIQRIKKDRAQQEEK